MFFGNAMEGAELLQSCSAGTGESRSSSSTAATGGAAAAKSGSGDEGAQEEEPTWIFQVSQLFVCPRIGVTSCTGCRPAPSLPSPSALLHCTRARQRQRPARGTSPFPAPLTSHRSRVVTLPTHSTQTRAHARDAMNMALTQLTWLCVCGWTRATHARNAGSRTPGHRLVG